MHRYSTSCQPPATPHILPAASGCAIFAPHPTSLQPCPIPKQDQPAFPASRSGVNSFSGSITPCPGIHKRFGILALMIIRRRRQRDENRGFPRRRDLGHGACARSTEQQVGPAEELRHVVDKGKNFRGDARTRKYASRASL